MRRVAARSSRRGKKQDSRVLHITIAVFATLLFVLGGTIYLKVQENGFCANSISCINDLSGKKEQATEGIFLGKTVKIPNQPDTPAYAISQMKNVLGTNTADTKQIFVDLTNQKMYAYEGSNLAYSFPVSTGKWNKTPTGEFRMWVWLRYTRMAGGSKAKGTYYNLPNVPYTMYYSNDVTPKNWGYSIHGAYWHNNFGQPMSHGCINMRPEDAAQIFYWSSPNGNNVAYPTEDYKGPLITVYGTTPS